LDDVSSWHLGSTSSRSPPRPHTYRLLPSAALVVAALGPADRRALRLAHPQLRDAVGEASTVLDADLRAPGAPPTAGR
jgi:hypothetical protein